MAHLIEAIIFAKNLFHNKGSEKYRVTNTAGVLKRKFPVFFAAGIC